MVLSRRVIEEVSDIVRKTGFDSNEIPIPYKSNNLPVLDNTESYSCPRCSSPLISSVEGSYCMPCTSGDYR